MHPALERLKRRIHQVADDQHGSIAMQALAPLGGRFLPWTPYSMSPSAILAVVTDIAVNNRTTIVECGSGNSTLFAARLLAELGSGHVTSIDHDADWARRTENALEREGLGEWARVVVAPLSQGWYDTSAIPQLSGVDLLVVDGPPANRDATRHARLPALTYFQPRLAPDATIILDDARRPGESEVVDRWRRATGRRFQLQRGGYAIAGPHYEAV
jgi:predicted O-methyltransferase YrrM